MNANIIDLGRVLQLALERGGFYDFCAKVPIHPRKARYLAHIAVAVDEGRLSEQDVALLQWTKAREIAVYTRNKTEAKKAVTYGLAHSNIELIAYLKQDDHPASISKTFFLTPAELNEMEEALLKAGARVKGGRLTDRGKALMAIIRAYRHKKLAKEA